MIANISKVVNVKQHPIPIDVVTCCSPLLDAPLGEDEAETLAAGFAALADPVRLRCLSMIAATDGICTCDLLEPLGKSQPTISHHTKALAAAGLIVGEKQGRWVWWRAVPERIAALGDALRVPALTSS